MQDVIDIKESTKFNKGLIQIGPLFVSVTLISLTTDG